MPSGIITKGIGGFYYVKTQEGLYECKARGIFRKDYITPLPGDRVNISIIDESKKTGTIDEIMPRNCQLVRPAVANVNQVVIVISVRLPAPDFMLLDKLLVTAEVKQINPIICISKLDLDENGEHKKILDMYNNTGYKVVLISAKTGIGVDDLKAVLNNKITVFAGQSGVGKSTILNKIADATVMQTGEISKKIERGKHTTRHAELIELATGSYVVDTPGFSSFELLDIKHDELQIYYPEFRKYMNNCKFTRCSHISEPGCLIKEALERREINEERYKRYVQLYNALKMNKNIEYKNKSR